MVRFAGDNSKMNWKRRHLGRDENQIESEVQPGAKPTNTGGEGEGEGVLKSREKHPGCQVINYVLAHPATKRYKRASGRNLEPRKPEVRGVRRDPMAEVENPGPKDDAVAVFDCNGTGRDLESRERQNRNS